MRLRAALAVIDLLACAATCVLLAAGERMPVEIQWGWAISAGGLALIVLFDLRAIRELTGLLSNLLRADVTAGGGRPGDDG
jgi:hypothetical protein